MRLLLDTHIWLWSLTEPARLSRKVASVLKDPGNELWISPISTWETLLLFQKGRLQVDGEPRLWLQNALAATPFKEAPLTHDIALATSAVDLPHKDPADRFLVATALILGLTLVTSDSNLLQTKAIKVLPNR